MNVDVAYCYRQSSVVCRSVCHSSESCKNSYLERAVNDLHMVLLMPLRKKHHLIQTHGDKRRLTDRCTHRQMYTHRCTHRHVHHRCTHSLTDRCIHRPDWKRVIIFKLANRRRVTDGNQSLDNQSEAHRLILRRLIHYNTTTIIITTRSTTTTSGQS